MTPPLRRPDVIKAEIEEAKKRFDELVYGQFHDRYSHASMLRQWQMLQESIAPLVTELVAIEEHQARVERLYRKQQAQIELRRERMEYRSLMKKGAA